MGLDYLNVPNFSIPYCQMIKVSYLGLKIILPSILAHYNPSLVTGILWVFEELYVQDITF